ALSSSGIAFAALWLQTGRRWRYRLLATSVVVITLAAAVTAGAALRPSWELSENRRNSFSQADEDALKQIQEPLRVTVYLSPEDPRLTDLDRSILSKLQRILPRVEVDSAASGRTGLF